MSETMLRVLRPTLAACAALVVLAASGARAESEDRHVRVFNKTHHSIIHFYASNVDADTWEEDILGEDVLKPGESVRINVDDGTGHCMYDFKAVFDDGDSVVRHSINVCTVGEYDYTED